MIFPYGHARPLLRPTKSYEDRALRKNIEDANRNGDCIINVGAGYYRPIPGDPVDEKELNEYLAQELHRARAIQSKRLAMKLAFERMGEKLEYLLVIPGRLDNLNDFIRADKSSRYKGGELKANNERIVSAYIEQCLRGVKIQKPVYMEYAWFERTSAGISIIYLRLGAK